MAKRLLADGPSGTVAIYEVPSLNSTDNAPFSDPLNNLSRVHFHSALDYISVLYTVSSALYLPPCAVNTRRNVTHTLFAHGLNYQPLVFGVLNNIAAAPVGWLGSVPIQHNLLPAPALPISVPAVRYMHLGANGTHVLAHENAINAPEFQGSGGNIPAITLTFTIYVSNTGLT